jgi:hypothetical protein
LPGYSITPGIAGVDRPTVVSYKARWNKPGRVKSWHELTYRKLSRVSGYPMLLLSGVNPASVDPRPVQGVTVQRLVCLALLGPCPVGCEIRHLDQRPESLRDPSFYDEEGKPGLAYGAHQNNVQDAVGSETMRLYKRDARTLAMSLLHEGLSARAVARKLGCHWSSVHRWRRELWAV